MLSKFDANWSYQNIQFLKQKERAEEVAWWVVIVTEAPGPAPKH